LKKNGENRSKNRGYKKPWVGWDKKKGQKNFEEK
jgi:hypothetical protein